MFDRPLSRLALLVGAGALVIGVSLNFAACQACDADVCSDSFRLIIEEPDGGALQDGSYDIHVSADGTSYDGSCVVSEGATQMNCDGLGHVVHAPLFGSPDAAHTTFWVDFPDHSMGEDPQVPLLVEVSIEFDGVLVYDLSVAPDYSEADPKCDPGCVSERIDATFDRA